MVANIQKWSKTAANNATADGDINWAEGQAPGTVNNSSRAEMQGIACYRDDTGGQLTTGGSSNSYTLTTNSSHVSAQQVDGLRLHFVANHTNTGAATLNVDTIGAKAIRKVTVAGEVALSANDIMSSGHCIVQYDASANSAAGAYILLNPTNASAFDITGLTAETTLAVADEVPFYDASATANRKITVANFLKILTALTGETSPATDDELFLYDLSATTVDKITLANLFKVITALTAETSPAADDELALYDTSGTATDKITLENLFKVIALITSNDSPATDDAFVTYDTSASAAKKMSFEHFLKVINGLTEDTAPTQADDFVPTYDASASGAKKVALAKIGAGKHSIYIPATAMTARTTNGAAAGTGETTTNKVMRKSLDFDTSTQEFAQFSFVAPKGWNESTVTFKAVWSHAATATNFGVVWELNGVALSDDDALDTAFGTAIEVSDTGGTTDDVYITSESSAVTIAGTPAEGDLLVFQIARDPSNGSDTLGVDARLHGVMVLYTTNANTDD